MCLRRLAGVLVGGAEALSSESEAEMMGFLRLVVVDLVAGVLVFFAVAVAGVDGIVPSPAKRFLLFLRILPKCSVRAFLVGAAPKEAAVIMD